MLISGNNCNQSKKKSNKSKLIRQGSTSSINSNSFYSSVLGSDNSHNSQVTNSSSSAQVVLTSNGELIRCTSYDPISIGGSSRRSSNASCSDIAANRRTSSSSSQAKHLTETNNLVIQPQSVSLTQDRYSSSVSSIGSSASSHNRRNRSAVPPPPTLNENTSASNHPNDSVTLEECDSDQPIETMNNIILPDDMVSNH